MKTALLLPLLLIAGAALAEGHARKTLQQTKTAAAGAGTTAKTTTTTTTRTMGATGATATVTPVIGGVVTPMGVGVVNPLGVGPVGVGVVGVTTPRTAATTVTTVTTVQTTKGPVKVGTVADGRARITVAGAAKVGASAAKVQNSQAETCRSVGPREYCGSTEQANCCEYLNEATDKWAGCVIASNLYTCVQQNEDTPLSVCCS